MMVQRQPPYWKKRFNGAMPRIVGRKSSTELLVNMTGRPIRVLAVMPAGATGSSMIFAQRQVASLSRRGVSCETFLLASRTSPWVLLKEWRRLRRAIRVFRPDVLHAHYGTVTALLSGLSTFVPVVVTFRGNDLTPVPSASWVLNSIRKLISEIASLLADRIICVSEELRQQLWWRKRIATVIPTGVDTDSFYPRGRSEARAQVGWPNRERVVLFNGAGPPSIKRPDLAQAAVDAARAICGDIRLVVLNGNIAPDSVPVLMSAADCLLLTSECEGSPTVVQEAMACNLPVVTVDVGDVQFCLSGVSPTRIVGRDPTALGNAIAEVLTEGQRSNGWRRVEHFSNAVIAEQVASIYRAISLTPHEDSMWPPIKAQLEARGPDSKEPSTSKSGS
jgi:glycosyltransferase involved in cell wall biosynthesis